MSMMLPYSEQRAATAAAREKASTLAFYSIFLALSVKRRISIKNDSELKIRELIKKLSRKIKISKKIIDCTHKTLVSSLVFLSLCGTHSGLERHSTKKKEKCVPQS
jgi:restriction endonuclease